MNDEQMKQLEGHSKGPWVMVARGQLRALGREEGELQSFGQFLGVFSTTEGAREHEVNNRLIVAAPDLFDEVKRLRYRNDFLEEIVSLLQEQGEDIEQAGFPRWEPRWED